MKAQLKTHIWWTALTLLLLLVFGARAWGLTQVPPGLTHDEASNGHDSAAILAGVHRIYFPVGYGHEPLYNYSVALTTLFLGQGIFTLRITTIFWGMAQCGLAVALARRWWGRPTALAVLAAYALSFWALMLARVGLRAPVLPALFTAAALAYDHAITAPPRRAWGGYALTGLCLGASFYTYMASRGMPLVFPLFLAGVTLIARACKEGIFPPVQPLRPLWRGTLAMLILALAVGAPLFLHLRAHPELEQRIGQLGHALTSLRDGDWRPLWANTRDSLPMLLWRGDPYWLYNVAGRPGLEPLLAVAFGIGTAAALAHPADRRHLFLLLWLAGGVAPALIAPVAYNLLHAIAALPAALLLSGRGITLGLSTVARLPLVRRRRAGTWALAAVTGALFLTTGWRTVQTYFVTWANHRDVRVAYHHHVVALGRDLNGAEASTPVVITSLYPGEFHDAYTMEVALQRDDLSLRWSDGRRALFVPTAPARLVVEPQSRPSDLLARMLAPDLTPDTELTFREDDLVPNLKIHRWHAPATWERLRGQLTTSLALAAGDPVPAVLLGEDNAVTTAPARFGDLIALEGYAINPDAPEQEALVPGSTLTLMTAWQVLDATDRTWVIFVHLLEGEGALITQEDRLDAPSWQWAAGDRFVQLHTLTLPQTLAPGTYALGVGLYAQDDLTRLPVTSGGGMDANTATRVLVPLPAVTP